MKALFVAYQDADSRSWTPVAKLTREKEHYCFVYTRGAEHPRFRPFGRMDDIKSQYTSNKIFPLFSNRLLPKSRPEYKEYLHWMGLTIDQHNELEELARTGGQRATDSLELIPCPEPTPDNRYEIYFFCRGLRHMPQSTQQRIIELKQDERLYLQQDLQNDHDKFALTLRTDDPISTIGYIPKYYTEDINKLLGLTLDPKTIEVTVERVNPEAPIHYCLLCKLSAPWVAGFSPCTGDEFKPLFPSSRDV